MDLLFCQKSTFAPDTNVKCFVRIGNNIMRKLYRVGILIIIIAYHADTVEADDVVEIINS